MQVKQLTIQNFRGYERATFDFEPGMNLIVGVNGVGKSSVLEALRLLLSHALPHVSASKDKPFRATLDDIAVGQDWLYATVRFRLGDDSFEADMRIWQADAEVSANDAPVDAAEVREDFYRFRGAVIEDRSKKAVTVDDAKQRIQNEERRLKALPKILQRADEQSIVVYFSTHRSLINARDETSRERSAAGQPAAFANAFEPDRQLKVAQFARWWVALAALTSEPDVQVAARAAAQIQVLEHAVTSFLDTVSRVQAVNTPKPSLLLTKAGITLDARLLSDGERSILALVLDIARRLSQANPLLEQPIRDGKAVVLIDELDLHLHPQWQRTIVQRLTETFPSCQFIATTHSPQIIGEVAPENIIILEPGKPPYRPDQSLGMDSNWILQRLMGAPDRNVEIDQQLERIGDLIEDDEYEQAAAEIARLRERMPDDLELVRLQVRLDRLQILGE